MVGKIRIIVFLILIILLLPAASGYWIRLELEKRTEMEIGGTYIPRLIFPSFFLRDAHFAWDDKVKLVSGHLKVDYDLFSLLSGRPLRVTLTSSNLTIKLLGEWADMEGISDVQLDRFYADLAFDGDGLREVFQVHAESPTLQFHFGESKRQKI